MAEPGAAFGPAGTNAAVRCSGLGHVGHCPFHVLWQRERFIPPVVVPGAPWGEISLYLLMPCKWGHGNPRPCCTRQTLFASVASLASGAGSSGDTGDAPGWELQWGWMVPMAIPVPEAPTVGQGPPRLLLAALAGDEASLAVLGGLPRTPLLLPASHTSCPTPLPAVGDSRSPSPWCSMGRGKDLPKDFGGCGRGHKSALTDDFRFVSVACR